MDRRKFLKRLGLGVAAVAVAPKAIEAVCTCTSGFKPLIGTAEEWCQGHGAPFVEHESIIKNYGDYANFSSFADVSCFDPEVMRAAEELGRAHAKRIRNLWEAAQLC